MELDETELSVRAFRCLCDAGLTTVEAVRYTSDSELLRLPGFGRKALREVRALYGLPVPSPTDLSQIPSTKLLAELLKRLARYDHGDLAELNTLMRKFGNLYNFLEVGGQNVKSLEFHWASGDSAK